MGVLNKLIEDSKLVPQTFWYKFDNNLLTIEDQQEALTKPRWSYYLAKENIPGSDIKALQAKACEDPECAFWFALDIPGADKEYCFKHAFPEEKYGPDRWKIELKECESLKK